MNLLRENDLIFGRLLKIEEPHLIARYNKALDAFGVPQTKLASFEIDRTGFSPQIAEELDDEQYLDPNGVNRRFIILTPAQIELPVVHTAFSNTSQLVYEFMMANARAINANLPELIDNNSNPIAMVCLQDPVEQGCFATAQKTAKYCCWSAFSHH